MYCDLFGLRCHPFEDRADANFLFLTPAFEEALAAMECEVRHDRGTGLVLGEAGIGKTVLIRSLVQRLTSSERVVVLTWPASEPPNLVRETAKGFGVSLPGSHQPKRLMGHLRRHLTRALQTGHRSVLIIDQAEHLTADDMGQVASLMDLRADDRRLLSMVLVGQPRLRGMLERPEFTSIAQHLFGKHVLTALRRGQTGDYIQHRLRVAGAADPTLFHENAVGLVHEMSGGIPRLINRICHAAMLGAYGANKTHVTKEMVEEVTVAARGAAIRTLKTDELGVADVEEVAAGLSTSGAATRALEPMTPDTSPAPFEPSVGALGGASRSCGTGVGYGADNDWISSSYAETGAGGEAPVALDTEGVVTRLERTLARAERVTATTEASISQFAAVEKHLTSLTTGAERVMGRVHAAVRRSAQSLDEARQRAERIAAQTEDRLRTMEAKLSQAIEAAGQAQRQADRVDRAREQAQDVESRLQSFAEQLADKADEVQERIGLLMTGLEASEATQIKLAALLEKAGAVAADPDKVTDTLKTKAHEVVEAATQQIERLTKAFAAAADPEKATEALKARVRHVVETATQQIERLTKALAAAAADPDKATEALKAKAQEALETATQQIERLTKAFAAAADPDKATEALNARVRQVVETAARRTECMGQEASTLAAQMEERLGVIRSTFERTRIEAEQFEGQFTNAVLRNCREKLQERLEAQLRTQKEIEAAISEQHARLEELTGRSRTTVRTMSETIESADARIDKQQQQAEDIARRLNQMDVTLSTLPDRVVDVSERLSKVDEKTTGLDDLVNRLSSRADATREGLTGVVPRAEALLHDVQAAYGRIEAVQQSVNTALGDIGGACERVNALRERIDGCHDLVRRLDTQEVNARTMVRVLEEAMSGSRPLIESLQQAVIAASEQHRSLDGQRTAVGGMLGRLNEADVAGHTILERIVTSTQAAEQAAETAAQRAGELIKLRESSGTAVRQLDDLVAAGRQLHEALQGLVAHTDAKIGQLDSHQAAATHAIGTLAEANRTAHAAIDQANASAHRGAEAGRLIQELASATEGGRVLLERTRESKGALELLVDSATTWIERLRKDAAAVTARTDTGIKGLNERNATAASLTEKLSAVLTTAGPLAAELAKHTDCARQQMATLAERCGQVAGLPDRLEAVSRQVDAANETESAIRKATETARATRDQLIEAVGAAGEHSSNLLQSSASVREMIETCARLRAEGEGVRDQLRAQLEAARHTIDSGEPLMSEYVAQTRELQQQMEELQAGVAAVEHSLSEATAKPAQLIADARAQGSQLERICAAVRKVFAGLSQASLDVRKHSAECTQATKQADERLARLTAETDRSIRMLHEWVEEANHAQARLERTLGQCPSIRETHPTSPIARMTAQPRLAGRIANARAVGELAELSEPSGADQPRSSTRGKRSGHGENVAQLIAEAREAVAVARS